MSARRIGARWLALTALGTRWPALIALGTTLLGAMSAQSKEESLPYRVNRAVDQGCASLAKHQAEDGSWETDDKVHPLGRTALTLLALHHGGDQRTRLSFEKGFGYLLARLREWRDARGKAASRDAARRLSTYETGITMMLLRAVGTPDALEWLAPLADELVLNFDRTQCLWGYPEGDRDLSNTQYALLGLRAAIHQDVRPRGLAEVLLLALRGVLRTQSEQGGFCYQPGKLPTSSMTVAGLALMQFLKEELRNVGGAGTEIGKVAPATKRAQAWLDQAFSVEYNVEGRARRKTFLLYYLYGLERYAAFYDLAMVAGRDWYQEGAEFLLHEQQEDGSWGVLYDTCFAILFLRRAAFTDVTGRKIVSTEPVNPEQPAPAQPPAAKPAEVRPEATIPFLREWLVAGVFLGKAEADDALETDFIDEKRAAALAGQRAGSKASRKWTAYESPEDKVDLQVPTHGGDHSATYAFLWVQSDVEREAKLWLGADDGVRIHLNGEMVFEHHHHDGVAQDALCAPLKLKTGWNKLLLKVENVGYFCYFFARVSDADGKQVAGLKYALNPYKK